MRRFPGSCLFVLLLCTSLTVRAQEQEKSQQDQQVLIRIIQDKSDMLGDFQSTVTLKKKQFKFQILLKNVEGVYVFASIRDSVYRFTESGPIRDFSYLPLLEMREDRFNSNKELNIAETGWSYWFYSPTAEWHPFNRKITTIDSNSNICTKWIKQFYDVADARVIKIKDIDAPLYLFFIAVAEYDDKGKPVRELMRRKVKIEWEDNDD